MKRLSCLLLFCFGMFITQSVSACTCVTVGTQSPEDPAKNRESLRRYYREQFKGALFTGKVVQSEVMWDAKHESRIRKVIVDVEKFWLGVDDRQITVYTWPGNGSDCGYPYEVGKHYFFNPEYEEGVLKISSCSYANGLPKDPEISTSKLVEILGNPQAFAPVRY